MKVPKKYQTLHCHTTTSDGLLSYSKVLDVCEKNNIGVVAFTDHDALIDKKDIDQLQKTESKIKWVSGIEISSGMPKEIGGSGSLHVVGLFVNPFDKKLVEHCKKAQQARIERMGKMVANLKSLGFKISEKDCLKASGGEAVGRPHIVKALRSKIVNRQVLDNLRKKMEKAAVDDPTLKESYDQMMERGEGGYPYALFLTRDAFIKGIYVDYTYSASLDESVELVRNAGGLAFLAHWHFERKRVSIEMLDKWLSKNRLDGIETIYALGIITKKQLDKETDIFKKMICKYNKLESGGVDAHRLDDFSSFVNTKWYAERTVGLVENIIQKSKVDTTWSSLK